MPPGSESGGASTRGTKRALSAAADTGSISTEASKNKRLKTGGRKQSDACSWCERLWTSSNPLRKGPGGKSSTLPRSKGYGCQCDVCKGAWNFGQIIADPSTYLGEMTDDDSGGLRATWQTLVRRYEDHRNGVEPGEDDAVDLPASRTGPLAIVEDEEDVKIVRQSVRWHFWQTPVFEGFFDKKLDDKLKVMDYDSNGADLVEGVHRLPEEDEALGRPIPSRVVKVSVKSEKGSSRKRLVGRSDQHIRQGQGSDAWAKSTAKLQLTDKLISVGDEPEDRAVSVSVVNRAAASVDGDDEDDEEDWSKIVPFAVPCPAAIVVPTSGVDSTPTKTSKPSEANASPDLQPPK